MCSFAEGMRHCSVAARSSAHSSILVFLDIRADSSAPRRPAQPRRSPWPCKGATRWCTCRRGSGASWQERHPLLIPDRAVRQLPSGGDAGGTVHRPRSLPLDRFGKAHRSVRNSLSFHFTVLYVYNSLRTKRGIHLANTDVPTPF